MDVEKLDRWAKKIHDNATAHGWHEEKHSPEHLLSLVMCEVAEAIEADRNGKTSDDRTFKNVISHGWDNNWYDEFIKGSISEEFADIVIRLLDMAYELYGADNLFMFGQHSLFRNNKSFVEHAWYFVQDVLSFGMMNISSSVHYIYDWAEQLGIDLDQHIKWKMKYNEIRPYKHGGKKY